MSARILAQKEEQHAGALPSCDCIRQLLFGSGQAIPEPNMIFAGLRQSML
jgi:hypothetical protein